ncbi:MAG: NINE protein [Clostridia bacterium]|nr:NINE protein [Clostridia bacterium]
MIECCETCGGELKLIEDDKYKCENCGNVYTQIFVNKQQEILEKYLDKEKHDKLNSLRRHLWQEVNRKYIDSKKVVSICLNIKNIYPEDFLANFYEVVCGDVEQETIDFINDIDVDEHYDVLEPAINFLIKSLKVNYSICLNNLIERAYKTKDLQTYNRLMTAVEKVDALVGAGTYNLDITRDVFVAYSSADMDKVQQVVKELEDEGLTCFVAMRNLQHGVGAVNNYQKALQKAIDNCKIFLFISSKNSRNFKCDAVNEELPYLRDSDKKQFNVKFRNKPYDKVDNKYKKPRVQLRLDNTKTMADSLVNEIFAGFEYCYDLDGVKQRIADCLKNGYLEEDLSREEQFEEQDQKLAKELKEQQEALKKQVEEQERILKQQAEEQERRLKEQKEEQEKRLKEEAERIREVEHQRYIAEAIARHKKQEEENRLKAEQEQRLKAEQERQAPAKKSILDSVSDGIKGFADKINGLSIFNNRDDSYKEKEEELRRQEQRLKEQEERLRAQERAINEANHNYYSNSQSEVKYCNKWVAFILCYIFGFFGAHKFYEGKHKQGLIYLCTVGIFGIGWFFDLLIILFKPTKYPKEN